MNAKNNKHMLFTDRNSSSGELHSSSTDCTNPHLVLTGQAPWGNVELKKADDGSIEGYLAWGNSKLQRNGFSIFGKSAWGCVDLIYEDGHLSGKMPWGNVQLTINDVEVKGDLPWGRCDLRLNGQVLGGNLPWGYANLHLAEKYHSLTDPDVIVAIAALLSDIT